MPRPKFRSKNEREAYAVLRELFPNTPIVHDYAVGGGLKVDFVIKTSVLMGVEIDGAQHYSYNSRWHKDKKDFEQQVRRDARKEELCVEKGIALVHHDARKGIEPQKLRSQVLGALSVASSGTVKSSKPKPIKSEWTLQKEREQKEYRKKAYQSWKAKRKNPNSRKG